MQFADTICVAQLPLIALQHALQHTNVKHPDTRPLSPAEATGCSGDQIPYIKHSKAKATLPCSEGCSGR